MIRKTHALGSSVADVTVRTRRGLEGAQSKGSRFLWRAGTGRGRPPAALRWVRGQGGRRREAREALPSPPPAPRGRASPHAVCRPVEMHLLPLNSSSSPTLPKKPVPAADSLVLPGTCLEPRA